MRSIKVKFSAKTASCTLAHPAAEPGDNADASIQVREIREIPDGVSDAHVLHIWSQTCDMSKRLSFRYEELAPGRILFK